MNQSSSILSPVTLKPNCRKVKSYSPQQLIETYRNDLKIEVGDYFEGIEQLDLWECLDSGLRFFIPNSIIGSGKFYFELQQYSWYYLPWKWEHTETMKLLTGSGSLLEIGCAEGEFLQAAQKKGLKVEGIELNQDAAKQARAKGLAVSEVLLSEFLKQGNQGKFDWVCSFQVLEHIDNVNLFINEALACLKPGGKLIVSIPNMDSFLKYDEGGILNFPPHHQGWYTESVMKSFEQFFPVKLIQVTKETLQKEHYAWFHKNMITKYYSQAKWKGSIYFRATQIPGIRNMLIPAFASAIDGHTMMAVYEKLK